MLPIPANAATTSTLEHALAAAGSDRARFQGRPERVSGLSITAAAGGAEYAALAITGFATDALLYGATTAFGLQHTAIVLATTLMGVLLAERAGLYSVPRLMAPLGHLPRAALSWAMALAFSLVLAVACAGALPVALGWVALWFATGLLATVACRLGAQQVLGKLAAEDRLYRRAVVFGADEAGAGLVAQISADRDSDVRIVGIFDDRGGDRIADGFAGYPILGKVKELVAFCRTHQVDLLILSLPLNAERRLLEILKTLWVLPVDIRLAAHQGGVRFASGAYSHVGSVPLLNLQDRPLGEWDLIVKAGFDRIVAALALVVLSPVLAAVALAVRLDSKGPILFRQKRLGFNNQMVDVWKFRSMYVDQSDATASRLVTRGDPRVTRVGRIIRKTSLDELPQLINVLTGSLSLVGPRPHALNAKAADRLYHEVVDGYFARHKVKPGITGLAQIRGWRGETDTEEKLKGRVDSDIEYIENWSLLLDVQILARTPLALLKSENAY